MQKSDLSAWVPLKTYNEDDNLLCHWMFTGDKKFSEPFFDDTISICKRLSQNSNPYKSASTLEMLPIWANSLKQIKPTAFIFHVSRCGSTLLAQLLGINPNHVVLSEVPFLDEVLRLNFKTADKFSGKEIDQYFHAALQLYAHRSDNENLKLFVKKDSWHLLFYDQLRKLYPDTPFIFLFRSPAEIIRSQKKQRGIQSIPGMIEAEVFGFTEEDLTFDLDLYMSRVLEKYFSKLLEIINNDKNFILCNFTEGMDNILDHALTFIGIMPSEEEKMKMKERMGFDGKRPQFFYEKEMPETIHPGYLSRCMELYDQVESKRKSLF